MYTQLIPTCTKIDAAYSALRPLTQPPLQSCKPHRCTPLAVANAVPTSVLVSRITHLVHRERVIFCLVAPVRPVERVLVAAERLGATIIAMLEKEATLKYMTIQNMSSFQSSLWVGTRRVAASASPGQNQVLLGRLVCTVRDMYGAVDRKVVRWVHDACD